MKSLSVIFFVLFVFVNGCNNEDKIVTPTSNPYSGNWSVVFAGSYTGGGTANINSDGQFSLTALLNSPGGSFTNTITGSVDYSGNLSGDIYYSGSKIGSVSGKYSGNAGSGSYQTSQPSSGTWSATKN